MQNKEAESQSGLKLAVILLFIFTLGFISFMDHEGGIEMNFDNSKTVVLLKLLQAFSVLMIFVLPSFLFAYLWTNTKIAYLGIYKKPKVSVLLISGVGMLMALPMINWLAEINQGMQLPEAFSNIESWMKNSEENARILTEGLTQGTTFSVLFLNLFVIAFMAAFSEEIFFRSILQKVIIEVTQNKHIGVWIGAALFSAFHMQFYGFLPRMLMGAYLGYLFLWSGSIWPGIFAHFANNGMAVFLIWLSNRGAISVDADKVGIEESEMIYVFISFIIVAASLFVVYRKTKADSLAED